MNTHPEALRLADELDVGDFDVVTNYEAASELRRLHEENERLKAATPVQEPVKPSLWERYHEAQTTTPPAALVQLAWVWQQAPVKTQWGHDMVVADLAIDKDHTVSIYCELDQTSKVEAMFTPPAASVQEASNACGPVIAAINDALADHIVDANKMVEQPAQQQEPFGYFRYDLRLDAWVQNREGQPGTPFYTSPPASKPLTDEQIMEMYNEPRSDAEMIAFARAIEAAHGIGEQK